MLREITVSLSSNNGYWQAAWKDGQGKRRKKSLGSKQRISARQARKLCQQLANQFNQHIALADVSHVPRLGDYADAYLKSRTDLRPGTLYLNRLTRRYLTSFFDESIPIDQISRAQARDWQIALSVGKFSGGQSMAAPTIRGHVINAKALFRRAVDDDLILINPFDRLSVPIPRIVKNWHYVSLDELEKLMAACRTDGWKLLVALCRLAGLRRGEALHLQWSAIDWANRRMTVFAEKTRSQRIVPIVPRLYELLQDASKRRADGQARICDVSPHCLWRNFVVIRRRAGLPPWEDAFQVMRRNCETDWAQTFPQYVVSEWLGHDIRVSAEHYLAVPTEVYERASKGANGNDLPQNLPQNSSTGENTKSRTS